MKWLEIFQKMIEDMQALLQKKKEKIMSLEDQETKQLGCGQVPRL